MFRTATPRNFEHLTSKSGPNMRRIVLIAFGMRFAPQQRSFSTPQLPKVVWPCVDSPHNSVLLFSALPCGFFVFLAPSRRLLLHRLLRHHQHNIINTTSSTQRHLHNTIHKTSSTQHHPQNIIYTTPSIQHHLHNIIDTTPSTQHHPHNTIHTTSSTQHHPHNPIHKTSSRQHPPLGATQHHHQHNIINRRSPTQHHLHNTIYTTPSTQHHQHNTLYTTSSNTTSSSLILRGRCSIRSNSREARRRLSTMDAGCFCVAGAAPRACHFAWQVQHSGHLQRGPRKSDD